MLEIFKISCQDFHIHWGTKAIIYLLVSLSTLFPILKTYLTSPFFKWLISTEIPFIFSERFLDQLSFTISWLFDCNGVWLCLVWIFNCHWFDFHSSKIWPGYPGIPPCKIRIKRGSIRDDLSWRYSITCFKGHFSYESNKLTKVQIFHGFIHVLFPGFLTMWIFAGFKPPKDFFFGEVEKKWNQRSEDGSKALQKHS